MANLSRAILLGGPEHGQVYENHSRWPIMALESVKVSLDLAGFRHGEEELKKHIYHERTIKCFNKYTKVGVHSDLTTSSFFDSLMFTTFIKESYQDLFRNL